MDHPAQRRTRTTLLLLDHREAALADAGVLEDEREIVLGERDPLERIVDGKVVLRGQHDRAVAGPHVERPVHPRDERSDPVGDGGLGDHAARHGSALAHLAAGWLGPRP